MQYLDLIAELGVGGAHPGGLNRTRRFVEMLGLPPGARILDAGCGTGESACYLAGLGYAVTAVDLNGVMLQKAKDRGIRLGAEVHWVEGNVERLPFRDGTFDAVLVESVTIFTDIPAALSEYRRVLLPGGKLLDCEMSLVRPMPEDMAQEFRSYMGLKRLMTREDWVEAVQGAGFRILSAALEPAFEGAETGSSHQEMGLGLLNNTAVLEAMMKYIHLVVGTSESFGAAILLAEKPV